MTIHSATANQDQIAALAHKIWEDEGRPEGLADSHWQRAVNALTALEAKPAAAKKPEAKPVAKKAAKSKA